MTNFNKKKCVFVCCIIYCVIYVWVTELFFDIIMQYNNYIVISELQPIFVW